MSLSKNWNLQINSSVFKFLKKIPHNDVERLLDVIKFLPLNPYFGDIEKMKGEEDSWRRRVGSYRIFFKINTNHNVILVFHIERRTSKTY